MPRLQGSWQTVPGESWGFPYHTLGKKAFFREVWESRRRAVGERVSGVVNCQELDAHGHYVEVRMRRQ